MTQRVTLALLTTLILLAATTMAAEDQKPSSERLREYRDSARESLLQQLYSEAPIYTDVERVQLADSLSLFVERRGGDHPLVREVLAGKSPVALAAELVESTRVGDVAFRKRLADGGPEAIDACRDPMIRLAKVLETESRRLGSIGEELGETQRQAYTPRAKSQEPRAKSQEPRAARCAGGGGAAIYVCRSRGASLAYASRLVWALAKHAASNATGLTPARTIRPAGAGWAHHYPCRAARPTP